MAPADSRPAPEAAGARLILALESATSGSSAAVLAGETLLAEACGADGGAHAETLLPAVEAVLEASGRRLDEIEAFAVAIGPGSFTGLRVGVATTKGLAFGSARPALPVSTLAALAHAAGAHADPVAAVLDARRGEIYAGVYACDAAAGALPRLLLEERVCSPRELAERLPARCRLAGAGARLLGGARPVLAEAAPRARHVGVLGARLLARGGGVEPGGLLPRYLRRAEAEVRRTGLRFEARDARGQPLSIRGVGR